MSALMLFQPLPSSFVEVLISTSDIMVQARIIQALIAFSLFLAILISISFILHESNFYKYFLSSLFSFFEKEVNAADDLIFTLSLVFVFFFMHIIGLFGNIFPSLVHNFSLLLILFTIVLIPTSMLFNFGFYFITFVRGSASSLSFVYELILDFINLISYYLRVCIQLVRVVIITITYFAYTELFLTYTYFYNHDSVISLSSSLGLVARLLFEIGHTYILFLAQFISFVVMVIWLFQFLFTSFFSEKLEI